MTSAYNRPQPPQYEICIRGHLGEMLRSAFPDLRAQTRGKDTVLTGALPDQAALQGVLAEIGALGLELVEVRRLPREDTMGLAPGMARRRHDRDDQ